ncbi:MAG: ATPase [Muribaculaceae bacterium]|nr:ATPase [Muribaculaceae bacterium]
MKNLLIADAGSSKVKWTLLSGSDVAMTFVADGLNALLAEQEEVDGKLTDVRQRLGDRTIDEVYYYGSGCAIPRVCRKMDEALQRTLEVEKSHVSSDLLGAARALFGRRRGIACILGTGSNSCLYDGEQIERNVPSLGYILGDEGSGAALGKRLVAEAFKGQLPANVREKFLDTYQLTLNDILDKVYRSPAPNKFLASLVPFLSDNLWNPYVYSLVFEELGSFIRKNVAMYDGAHFVPVSFTGSIAHVFEKVLREAAAAQGYKVTEITADPMEGLIKYHSDETAD